MSQTHSILLSPAKILIFQSKPLSLIIVKSFVFLTDLKSLEFHLDQTNSDLIQSGILGQFDGWKIFKFPIKLISVIKTFITVCNNFLHARCSYPRSHKRFPGIHHQFKIQIFRSTNHLRPLFLALNGARARGTINHYLEAH